jgi:hypothetical protein
MAEAVLAGEKIEEFFLAQIVYCHRFFDNIPGFAKDLLVRDCPCDAGYGNGNQEKINYLR